MLKYASHPIFYEIQNFNSPLFALLLWKLLWRQNTKTWHAKTLVLFYILQHQRGYRWEWNDLFIINLLLDATVTIYLLMIPSGAIDFYFILQSRWIFQFCTLSRQLIISGWWLDVALPLPLREHLAQNHRGNKKISLTSVPKHPYIRNTYSYPCDVKCVRNGEYVSRTDV